MARFLIDEDLPLSLSHFLRQKGHTAEHIIELGQRGAPDGRVFALAQEHKAILVSRDTDFGNVLQFPLGSHGGIVVVRFPSETQSRVVVEAVAEALTTIEEAVFAGALMVVEPGRMRIRRPI
jgi:predicted nuclease of predicted toxin-antitoxin system